MERRTTGDVMFTVTFGAVPGYLPSSITSACSDYACQGVTEAWTRVMEHEVVDSGIVVDGAVSPSRISYVHDDRVVVEIGATVTGISRVGSGHPSVDSYRDAVRRVVDETRRILEQRTAHLAFASVDCSYFAKD